MRNYGSEQILFDCFKKKTVHQKFFLKNILIQWTSSRAPIWMKIVSKFSSCLHRQTGRLYKSPIFNGRIVWPIIRE